LRTYIVPHFAGKVNTFFGSIKIYEIGKNGIADKKSFVGKGKTSVPFGHIAFAQILRKAGRKTPEGQAEPFSEGRLGKSFRKTQREHDVLLKSIPFRKAFPFLGDILSSQEGIHISGISKASLLKAGVGGNTKAKIVLSLPIA
jgi:hypothetical protein